MGILRIHLKIYSPECIDYILKKSKRRIRAHPSFGMTKTKTLKGLFSHDARLLRVER